MSEHRSQPPQPGAGASLVMARQWVTAGPDAPDQPPPASALGRAAAWLGGLGISVAILLALHFAQHIDAVRPTVEARELRAIALPPPPPPPTVTSRQPPPPELMEIVPVPTASPVKFIVPLDPVPVPRLSAGPAITFSPDAFKPSTRALERAPDRIYHAAEVDRIPVPVYRRIPRVSAQLLYAIRDTHVRLTFVVTTQGAVENITVLQAATPEYGQLVADAVAEWRFEPAMKGGRRVRCFVMQSVTVRPPGAGSPFSAD
jgi:TonB family protein